MQKRNIHYCPHEKLFLDYWKNPVSLRSMLVQSSADSQHFTAAINMVAQNIQKFKEQLHICDLIQQCDKGSQQSKQMKDVYYILQDLLTFLKNQSPNKLVW